MSSLPRHLQFFYSKGAVCCDAVRALLGCPAADPLSPCAPVAFTGGSCADLLASDAATAVFATLPDGQYISSGAFVCTAFPADDNARDTFLSGVISFAVSIPLCVVVANCFGLSTATDDDQLHGRTRWMVWPAARRLVLGRLRWRWARHPAQGRRAPHLLERLRRFLASWWCTSIYVDAMVAFSDALPRCVCKPPPRLLKRICPASALDDDSDGDESLEAYTAAVDAEMAEWRQEWALQAHFSLVTTRFKHAGYVILHLAWGFFAWVRAPVDSAVAAACAR